MIIKEIENMHSPLFPLKGRGAFMLRKSNLTAISPLRGQGVSNVTKN